MRAETFKRENDKKKGLKLHVVYNYGHGGSGWALAVGCARTAVFLLEQILVNGQLAETANGLIYPFPLKEIN